MNDIANDYIKRVDIKNATQMEFQCAICGSSLRVHSYYLHGSVLMNKVELCPNCRGDDPINVNIIGNAEFAGAQPKQIIEDDPWE